MIKITKQVYKALQTFKSKDPNRDCLRYVNVQEINNIPHAIATNGKQLIAVILPPGDYEYKDYQPNEKAKNEFALLHDDSSPGLFPASTYKLFEMQRETADIKILDHKKTKSFRSFAMLVSEIIRRDFYDENKFRDCPLCISPEYYKNIPDGVYTVTLGGNHAWLFENDTYKILIMPEIK